MAKKTFNSDFSDQYKSPKWQKVRLQVLERDDFCCQNCHTDLDRQLHVNHKEYISGKKLWDYPLDNFISLCDKCHEQKHILKKGIDKLLSDCFNSELENIYRVLLEYKNNPEWFMIFEDIVIAMKDYRFMNKLICDIKHHTEIEEMKSMIIDLKDKLKNQ